MTSSSAPPPIESACYWLATRPRRAAEPLSGDHVADVTIVGAGFTGLWTGLFLKDLEPSLGIAILEQGMAGDGASGRNAGIVGETLDHSHELAASHFGMDEARELARLGRENLDELARFLSLSGIDAEFERPGQLIMALTPAHVGQLRESVAFAHRLGLSDWRFLEASEAQSELSSPLYLGAALAPKSGTLHPMKLLEGLRREALRRGIAVFEETSVQRLSRSAGRVVAQSRSGSMSSDRVVLAANAYSHRLRPRLLRRFLPLYDYILVSEPLTEAQREAIGWRGRQGVTDARTFFNYYRLTSDGRILFGTSEAVYYPGNRVDPGCDHSPAHYESLRASFRRHFPPLSDLRFPYAWGGPICSTTRLTPFFGEALGGRLLYGLGYTGHGLGSTRLAGRILAHLALARKSPLLELSMVRRPPFPFPPEPVRRAAVRAVTRALRRVDGGQRPGLLLRILESLGINFSS
ncbi:MAG TPA: FAD-binding oxidoreductase [Thermoanaerobaculia bacterium]|nr:FAD-binding oxidoreductase [Thermoanaerobaculia bacterium]